MTTNLPQAKMVFESIKRAPCILPTRMELSGVASPLNDCIRDSLITLLPLTGPPYMLTERISLSINSFINVATSGFSEATTIRLKCSCIKDLACSDQGMAARLLRSGSYIHVSVSTIAFSCMTALCSCRYFSHSPCPCSSMNACLTRPTLGMSAVSL